MGSGRRWRIGRLEAMLEEAMCPQCAGVTYAYGLEHAAAGVTFDDAIYTAVTEQAGYARQIVALPAKMEQADWIGLAQMNQGEFNV